MSLSEIKAEIRALSPTERFQFVSWIYSHESELIEPTHTDAIIPELMDELLRRRLELKETNVATFSIEEASVRVREALDEVQRPRH